MTAITKVEEFFVCVFLAALILLVFFAAIFRFFGVNVAWSIDIAQLMFAWTTFIGADLALRKNKHMGVNLLIKQCPMRVQRIVLFLCYLVIVCFLLVIVFYGARLSIINYRRFFATLPISFSFVTAAAPVGAFLMLCTMVTHITTFFREGAFRGIAKA